MVRSTSMDSLRGIAAQTTKDRLTQRIQTSWDGGGGDLVTNRALRYSQDGAEEGGGMSLEEPPGKTYQGATSWQLCRNNLGREVRQGLFVSERARVLLQPLEERGERAACSARKYFSEGTRCISMQES